MSPPLGTWLIRPFWLLLTWLLYVSRGVTLVSGSSSNPLWFPLAFAIVVILVVSFLSGGVGVNFCTTLGDHVTFFCFRGGAEFETATGTDDVQSTGVTPRLSGSVEYVEERIGEVMFIICRTLFDLRRLLGCCPSLWIAKGLLMFLSRTRFWKLSDWIFLRFLQK